MTNDAGRFLVVWEHGGDQFYATERCEDHVHSAVSVYLLSGRDSIIELEPAEGTGSYWTLASNVSSWGTSTPEGREAGEAHRKAIADEQRTTRQALGIWDAEE